MDLDSDVMDPVPMGTHKKINLFIVGREIWEAIEKTAQELIREMYHC
jgi:hypothetical protein